MPWSNLLDPRTEDAREGEGSREKQVLGISGCSEDPLGLKKCSCCQRLLSLFPRALLGLVPGLQSACMRALHFIVCKALLHRLSH